MGKTHSTQEVNVYKTHTLDSDRTSYFEPCSKVVTVKENYAAASHKNTQADTKHKNTADVTCDA